MTTQIHIIHKKKKHQKLGRLQPQAAALQASKRARPATLPSSKRGSRQQRSDAKRQRHEAARGFPANVKLIRVVRIHVSQKHLRWTMPGPLSSYSSFEIHISWKVLSEDRIEPPIHTEYLRSGGATILTLIEAGASAVISLVRRASMLGNMVVPPLSTVLVYRSRRMSTSHFMIDSYANLWMPSLSLPIRFGWNSTSGQRKRSAPIVITCPSGSS